MTASLAATANSAQPPLEPAPAPMPQGLPPARPATGGVWQLALAQFLALLVAACAAVLYGRWLQPAELAAWLLALGVARAGLLLLEGGLKTTLVRRPSWPGAADLQALLRQSTWLCGAAAGLVCATAAGLAGSGRIGSTQAWLLAVCAAAYFCSLPPLAPALARLERAGQFGAVGRAEGAALLLEFALPAALLAAGLAPVPAFCLAVVLARALRTGWIVRAARALPAVVPDPNCAAAARAAAPALWRDGASVQAVAGLSMLRDQMHLWLLGPWYGAAWAGVYALAGTACALASQAPVQTAARVALPVLRSSDPAARWPALLRQTRWLALACLPPLLLLPAWLAWADAALWAGAWAAALPLLPWLLLRMVAGVALTTLGVALLLAPHAWSAARTHAGWTVLEIALAVVALAVFGPLGLAIAGAVGGWLGLLLFLRATAGPGAAWWPQLPPLLAALLLRPSVALAALLAAWASWQPQALWAATLALPLCWLAEPGVRRVLRAQWPGSALPASSTRGP